MAIRVVMAGATGWVGKALVPAIMAADDLELAGAVARGAAGKDSMGDQAVALLKDGGVRVGTPAAKQDGGIRQLAAQASHGIAHVRRAASVKIR